MGDPLFYELFQPTRNDIVAFYSLGDLSKLMILSVEYADSAPVSVQKEALKIAGYMTQDSDVYLEDVDANPWNLKFANFLLNGRFRNMGQEYFDDTEMQACLFNVAGDDYPELIITNGAADGQPPGHISIRSAKTGRLNICVPQQQKILTPCRCSLLQRFAGDGEIS